MVRGLAVVLALALAACRGGGGGGGEAVRSIDACSLLTAAEIEQHLGKPVREGQHSSVSGNAVGCEWLALAQADGVSVTVTITVFDPDVWAIQKAASGVEPVAGLGDEALRGWVTQDLLSIRKGNLAVDFAAISVFGERTATMAAQLELARLLVSRL